MLDGHATNAFWKDQAITTAATRQVLKARYGQIWTMRKAYNYRMPYFRGGKVANNIKCPHCHHNASTGHMLGECCDKDMKGMYIERHNEALRLIAAEIQKGESGNHMVYLDAGKDEKVQHLACPNKQIPHEIISNRTLRLHGMNVDERRVLRPDALIIESNDVHIPATGKRDAQRRHKPARMVHDNKHKPPIRRCKAYIIEVGYSAETRYEAKVQEKIKQHEKLTALLEEEGFEVILQPIVLGTTGGIFHSQNSLLGQLGIVKARQQKLNRKLHRHSIHSMHSIIKSRRLKESHMQGHRGARVKKPPDK